jgi:hypothetical protein
MADPVSISLKNFSATAKASVTKALAAHHTAFAKPDYRFGFVPPWWLGIIIYNPSQSVTVAQAQALATDIHSGVSGAARKLVVNPGEPGVECGPGHIICGFILPPDRCWKSKADGAPR